jgi:hypothetical protein
LKFALAQQENQSMKRNRFSEEQIIGILKEHEFAFSFHPRPDLALRYAKGSAPAPVAHTARQGNPNARSELTSG